MKFAAQTVVLLFCFTLCVVGAIYATKDGASKPTPRPESTRILNEQTQHRTWLHV